MAHFPSDSQVHEYSVTRAIAITCLFFSCLFSYSQQVVDKKSEKLVAKSDEILKDRDFGKAKELLFQAIERNPDYAKAYEKLFVVLKILGEEKEIHKHQLLYVKNVPSDFLDRRVWQSLASYEFANGDYSEANEYISLAKSVDSVLYKSIQFAIAEVNNPDTLDLSELPAQVNRMDFQYLPTLTVDKRTLIFTGRDKGGDEDILLSRFDGTSWSEAESISENINTNFNEGACSISADGRTLIFTACEGRSTYGNCDLYMAKKVGSEWSSFKNLGKTVNSRFWDSQPALSADGNTLYFVSNRPGGIGGRDIWVTKFVDGKWTTPINIGSSINTVRDETTPFIHSNSKTLFLSSNGQVRMGGFDLYSSELKNERWEEVENLGYPINTYQDEVSLFITSDGDEAYFAKEYIEDGVTKSSRLVSYNIPRDKRITEATSYLTGVVTDAKNQEPIEAGVQIVDLENGDLTYSTTSDAISGRYFLILPSEVSYGVFLQKEGYLFEELSFESSKAETDTIDFELRSIEIGEKVILKNIYFEINSDQLDKKSNEELDRVVYLLKNNPGVHIEITGHTDDTGSKKHNLDLSIRRAGRVHNYLLIHGVDSKRLSYRGQGDKEPLNQNLNPEEKQLNRRIEFIVLSKDN